MFLLGSTLLALLLLDSAVTGNAGMYRHNLGNQLAGSRGHIEPPSSLVLPRWRHFARLHSSMQPSLHQQRKMLLHTEAAGVTAHPAPAVEFAATASIDTAAQQQQQQSEQQQMVAEFLETGHKTVNDMVSEQFRPPENEAAVGKGVPKSESKQRK